MCLVVKFSTVSAIRAASALLILTHFPTTTGSGEKNTPNQNFIQPFFFLAIVVNFWNNQLLTLSTNSAIWYQ